MKVVVNTSTNAHDVQAPETFDPHVVCAIEVPLDEAIVPEVADQLVYLYGFDCYAHWRGVAATWFPSPLS